MSGSSMNFATSGYRRGNRTQSESKTVFLDSARTRKIREDSIVRVPDILGDGKPLEGRVLFIGDNTSRALNGTKHAVYLTVCINEQSLTSLLVFKDDWPTLEVVKF
tara:strand:- start:1708 stop:2025 length:318 start_codon:yes stop_codon:yes gene_type:complete